MLHKKRIITITLLIFSLLVGFLIYKNNLKLKNLFVHEKMIDITLCGESYHVVDININGRYVTKELVEKGSTENGFNWCENIKTGNLKEDRLQVNYSSEYPNDITIIYRAIRYEYVVKSDGIYIVDEYAGGLGLKILELNTVN